MISQDNVAPGAGSQFRIGDVVQSVFISSKAPTAGGWIWGVGPVLLLPTGSNDQLMSVGGGVRYRVARPTGGPSGVSLRLSVTLLFPR